MKIREKNIFINYYDKELKCIHEKDFELLLTDLKAHLTEVAERDALIQLRKDMNGLIDNFCIKYLYREK